MGLNGGIIPRLHFEWGSSVDLFVWSFEFGVMVFGAVVIGIVVAQLMERQS